MDDSHTREIDLIIGLLSKNAIPEREGLPLGWKSHEISSDLTLFYETTISPSNPSVTFQKPSFSLLQERRIALGSPDGVHSGPVYKFDLVRFIEKPTSAVSGNDLFDINWYKSDLLDPHMLLQEAQTKKRGWDSILLDFRYTPGEHSSIPVVRQLARLFTSSKVTLLHSYLNVLLICFPLSILADSLHWNSSLTFALSFLAFLSIIGISMFATRECAIKFVVNLDESILSYVGNCIPELLVSDLLSA